jgi:hypothetical protein
MTNPPALIVYFLRRNELKALVISKNGIRIVPMAFTIGE